MTSINWNNYPPVPGFDSIRMKKEIQEKMYEETQGMTREEMREYLREGAMRFDKEQELHHTEWTVHKSQ